MKITLGRLRSLLREAIVQKPLPELEQIISAMDPDEISPDDFADSDTGEVHLEQGKKARTSRLHPQFEQDATNAWDLKRGEREAEEARDASEDEEYEDLLSRNRNSSQGEFESALKEYAENWVGHEVNHGGDAQADAFDAAEGFFHAYPQWKKWARNCDMTRDDILSAVADFVHDAMIRNNADE